VVEGLSAVHHGKSGAVGRAKGIDHLSNGHPHALEGDGTQKQTIAVFLPVIGRQPADQFILANPVPKNGLPDWHGGQGSPGSPAFCR
jgi:hypothetical protein